MTLLQQINNLWTKKMEYRVDKWANALKGNEKKIIAAAKKFHEWEPLHVYLPVTRAMNPSISFSLRYQGQEVASLAVKGDDVYLVISPKMAAKNEEYFCISKQGKFPWQGKDAIEFRKRFNKVLPCKALRIQEHRIESEFLKQMADSTSGKFDGTLKNIQPVLLAGCPFQFPLPISGNTGAPKCGKGNIDILARRGIGKGTKISIWELKKPNTTVHAIEQAYIYAVTLIKMLRSPQSGSIWYKDIIGFKGGIPDKLTIESIVAVSLDNRKQAAFNSKLQTFKAENSLTVGNDTIKLYVAYYTGEPLQVSIQEI